MAIPLATVGQVLTADFVNQWLAPLAAYKTGTTSRTNNTLSADPDLTVTVAANAVYKVDLGVIYDGVTAADIQLAWTIPAGATVSTMAAVGISTTAASSYTEDVTLGASTNPSYGALGTGTNCAVFQTGLLTTAGTAGTFALQWAQLVTNATATRLFAGSFLFAQRVG